MEQKTRDSLQTILNFLNMDMLGAVEGDTCLYYDPNERRYCAIGCLLADDLLDELVERDLNRGYNIEDIDKMYTVLEDLGLTLRQAQALQSWHDAAATHKHSASKLKLFAEIIECLLDGTVNRLSLNGDFNTLLFNSSRIATDF